eukprot:TRINITY_DN7111_c0_g1_i1.p1 TRINITY_DN7111_c0_g1~~TRINITY_DN7111_c0_g1_i1.p1  ORF type:complete len:210 (-),score=12.72 TRINITY_DN7111_c0_g1_i1:54-683(-)
MMVKVDIFAFGIMMLEVMQAPATLHKRTVRSLALPRIIQSLFGGIEQIQDLVKRCLSDNPHERPDISEIVHVMERSCPENISVLPSSLLSQGRPLYQNVEHSVMTWLTILDTEDQHRGVHPQRMKPFIITGRAGVLCPENEYTTLIPHRNYTYIHTYFVLPQEVLSVSSQRCAHRTIARKLISMRAQVVVVDAVVPSHTSRSQTCESSI